MIPWTIDWTEYTSMNQQVLKLLDLVCKMEKLVVCSVLVERVVVTRLFVKMTNVPIQFFIFVPSDANKVYVIIICLIIYTQHVQNL